MRVVLPDRLELELGDSGDGPPALLVHGFGGSRGAWGEAALGLAERFRVLAVDLVGHGSSGDPRGPARVAIDRVLDDLERALDAAGLGACAWVGYSMGGRIALAAAVLRPRRVSHLVLESASPGLATEAERRARREQDEALARRIEEVGVTAWAAEWESRPIFGGRRALPTEVLEPFLELRRANRAASLAAWLRGLGVGSQPSFWDRLDEVGVPTLLLTGGDDPRYGDIARRMCAGIARPRHVEVPGAGHTVHLERPELWVDAVAAFLRAKRG